jgi:Flp pilus assembly protein TadD
MTMNSNPTLDPGAATARAPRASKAMLGGLSLAVVALACAGYGWTGSPHRLSLPGAPAAMPPGAAAGHDEKGDEANRLLDRATTLAIGNNHVLSGEPARLIERALQIEPDNLRALALSGTAAFARGDYAAAARHWERLAELAPPDSDFIGALQSRLELARRLIDRAATR